MSNRSALVCGLVAICFELTLSALATDAVATNDVQYIDLATTLRLAGAQNLDIQLAQERLAAARASLEATVWQFFPWISPGVTYRRHDNLIQDVGGSIIDVHKESYGVGPSLYGQVDFGDALYKNLASRQLVKASDYALESQRQETLLTASQAYFDLVKARSAVSVTVDSVRIATNYLEQIKQAVEAGLAFKGEILRVQVQAEQNRITLRQAQEQERASSARLVQILHLKPTVELSPNERELIPTTIISTNTAIDSLMTQAFSMRPELKESQANLQAARETKNGAVYGPLIPTLGAQVFAGGLGGGKDGEAHPFGESEDYQVTLGWRLGPGGLFDRSRIRLTEARLRLADVTAKKAEDEIARQVIESQNRSLSLNDQLTTAERAVQAAEESLRLSQDRKQFAVGDVLEVILAEQELTRARLTLSNAIGEYNKAQYALARAVGSMTGK